VVVETVMCLPALVSIDIGPNQYRG
jgi:hypothetical protein